MFKKQKSQILYSLEKTTEVASCPAGQILVLYIMTCTVILNLQTIFLQSGIHKEHDVFES